MNNQPSTTEALHALEQLTDPAVQGSMQSDAELLTLFVESGNRAAIETLILRYSGMVASVCRATVSDSASAEDAFQATFLVLLKSAKKIQKRRSLAAWLHGVAYRTACRARKQHSLHALEQSPDEVIALNRTDEDPINVLARKLELEALDQELEKLPTNVRDILVEHYLLGYTAPQIAERTALSVAAVEGRIRRGRYALLRQLAKRGISLTVLVAASNWFQQHLQATEATDWADTFLNSYLPEQMAAPDSQAGTQESDNHQPDYHQQVSHQSVSHQSITVDAHSQIPCPQTPSPHISSLVRGEMNMLNTVLVKSLAPSGAVVLVGALFGFNLLGEGQTPSAGFAKLAASGSTISSMPEEATAVVAQFGNASAQSSSGAPVLAQLGGALTQPAANAAPAATAVSPTIAPAPAAIANAAQGAAVAATQQPGNTTAAETKPSETKPAETKPIEWKTPEGEPPLWLREGTEEFAMAEQEFQDQIRAKLRKRIEIEFQGVPFRSVMQEVGEMIDLPIVIDTAEFALIGCDLDTPITIRGSMSVREFLRRVFQEVPDVDNGLAYTIHENSIEITSLEDADQEKPIRYYDLAYVLPNDSHVDAVTNAIQQSIDPDSWLQAGGTNTVSQVGSMLIIACPEVLHQKIEVMLARIATINKSNLQKQSSLRTPAMAPQGGMGGGMGGMGGGMGGMGGGMGGMF